MGIIGIKPIERGVLPKVLYWTNLKFYYAHMNCTIVISRLINLTVAATEKL